MPRGDEGGSPKCSETPAGSPPGAARERGDRPVAGGVPCGSARGGARDANGRPLRAAARGLYGDADRDAARSRDLRRAAARRRGLWRSGSATKASHVSERDPFSQAVFSLRPRLSRHERPLVRRASYLLPVRIHPCRPDCIARPPDSRVGGRTIQAYQSMYPAGPPGLDRSEPRGQTCLHFRQVTVAGSSSGDWVRTCGPGSPHAGHVPRYISSALTAASSWGKPKSTSHRGPDPQQRIRCEKLEGHGTTFTVRPRPHRAYPEAAVDRSPERRIGELSERLYFGSTTTGRSSAQSGAREGLSEMGRRQSAKNARRFSPRRRPAERTRRPSCRHARGRGEPLLRPEAVGPARYSRHAESLACAARAFMSPSRFPLSNHGTYRSVRP